MTDSIPNTRLSLILRLPKPDQQLAWQEFVDIYDPFLYRFMRRRGLDDFAARDLVQRVMMSVMQSVEKWQPISGGPKFRSWLFAIARNHLINERRRNTKEAQRLGVVQELSQAAMQTMETLACDESDFRREAILFAASRIRCQLEATTWQAFWLTSVEGLDCKEAASELGIDVGSVYTARSRVLRRVREQLNLMLECENEVQ
jgi:RNA polymerase sigma-70 factor (ECF subfamily)